MKASGQSRTRYQMVYRQVWAAGKAAGVDVPRGYFVCRGPIRALAHWRHLLAFLGPFGLAKTILKLCTSSRLFYGVRGEKSVVHMAWVTLGHCRHYDVEPGAAVIGPVFTAPDWRGRGVASACARQVMAELASDADRICYIDTSNDNVASQKFIAKCGFGPPVGVYMRPAGNAAWVKQETTEMDAGALIGGSRPSVVHVAISLAPGGLERLVVRWTNGRNERFPASTAVCCLDEAGALVAELMPGTSVALGAKRDRFPWDRDAVRRLRALACERGAAVLHSHNLAAQQYAVLAAWGAGLRVVHTEHGSRPAASGMLERLRESELNRLTDRIVAVSEGVAARFAGRAAVIRNGVSPHVPVPAGQRAALRDELGLPAGSPVIGFVGRLATVKGADRLLWAFGQLAASRGAPQCTLLLVGDGPDRPKLEFQARRLGVDRSTVFAGFRSDARSLYDIMDCFVLPSRSEGLAVALLEAMAAGVPALATDVGANREVLLGGEAGVLLPLDCGQWADIMRGAIERPEDLKPMVEKASDRVARYYSEAATAEAYERIYGEV